MNTIQTVPSQQQMEQIVTATPGYMMPDVMPSAVVLQGYVMDEYCDRILAECNPIEPHEFHGCNASTTEIARPLSNNFRPILDALLFANDYFFQFDINAKEPAAWMQTYRVGNDYKQHQDAAPGQSRKLTAVLMLTDPKTYLGGHLVLQVSQKEVAVPAHRGTVIVFPAYVPHRVTEIDEGVRQTINLGVWGPPFK